MSAFIVSAVHISALVDAAASCEGLYYFWDGRSRRICGDDSTHDRDRVFALLRAENYASVNARYNKSEQPDPSAYSRSFKPRSAVQILKAIACYEYQSCEHEGWMSSEARAICDSLRKKMIAALDGYENAAWELAA